ncbi:MAG TPA: MOSC domain-containing protein [Burkholderiales bacterium]|nr:MOSC domain-containing protein [Burkholderiales bacterium]
MNVAALWRYPVKSMLGEPCREVELDARGVKGDRVFAVRDRDAKLGSGKDTRRFRSIEGLFSLSARWDGEWPEIAFPNGRRLRGDDPGIDQALSAALGVAVTLARESDVPHFDSDPIHVVTTASLDWLRVRLPGSRIDERRFRPNIVLDAPGEGQPELSWTGRTLRVGEATLRITSSTERCRMTTLAQADLPADPLVLRAIAQDADVRFGVYAETITPGRIAVGDCAIFA